MAVAPKPDSENRTILDVLLILQKPSKTRTNSYKQCLEDWMQSCEKVKTVIVSLAYVLCMLNVTHPNI